MPVKGFKDRFAFLSNFYQPCSVEFEGLVYPSSENAFQAAKILCATPEETNREREAQGFLTISPAESKVRGRRVQLRPDWNTVSPQIMYEIVRAKFTGNPELRQMLLDTQGAFLEETNRWHDNQWGNCNCSKCEKIVGKNLLGKILMRIRDELTGNVRHTEDQTLTSAVIPDGVTEIGFEAFRGCTALTSVVIPNSVKQIGLEAFRGCTALTSVVIPPNVVQIGSNAFEGCTSLTSVVLPQNVTNIENNVFANCVSLTSIELPARTERISWGAFDGCRSLTKIVIPKGVTFLGARSFRGCSSLTSLVIPEGVTKVGEAAFQNCSALTSITLPNSLCWFQDGTFAGCASLKDFQISDDHPSLKCENGQLMSKKGKVIG